MDDDKNDYTEFLEHFRSAIRFDSVLEYLKRERSPETAADYQRRYDTVVEFLEERQYYPMVMFNVNHAFPHHTLMLEVESVKDVIAIYKEADLPIITVWCGRTDLVEQFKNTNFHAVHHPFYQDGIYVELIHDYSMDTFSE